MKRIILLFIALSILCSITVFGADIYEDAALYQKEVSFLKTLKISNVELCNKDTLTRGEFIALVIDTFFPDKMFSYYEGENIFEDLDSDYKYFGEIAAAKGLGIVKGTSLSRFNPDGAISYNDALVVLINAMGYTLYADANGGYPTGYLSIAQQIGLLKGVEAQPEISGPLCAKLIYNALFVNEVTISSIGQEEIDLTVMPDTSLLDRVYKIKKYNVTVVANCLSSISGTSLTDVGSVVLRDSSNVDHIVYTNDSGVEWELGKTVVAYVRNNIETGRNEVVHFDEIKNLNEKTILSEEIINITASYIEYENSDGKIEKITINNPYVIFNGVFQNQYNNAIFKANDGIITFTDNDGNNTYDIVNILSFNYKRFDGQTGITQNQNARNIVVDRVDAESGYISCKWNPAFGNLNLDKDIAVVRVVSDDENINELSDIIKGDIVSVAQAPEKCGGKEFYTLVVSRKTIKDIFQYANPSEQIVGLNGVDYKVSSSVYSVRANYGVNLQYDTDITVLIDATGKIAYFNTLSNISSDYAYLINAAVRTKSGEDVLIIKIIDNTGSVNEYEVTGKAKIDGKTYQNATEQYTNLAKRPANYGKWIKDNKGNTDPSDDVFYENSISRPLIIKKNSDGMITSINTDTPDYAVNSSNQYNYYTDQNAIGYSDEEIADNSTLKAGYRSHRLSGYRATAGTVDGKFFVNSGTFVFKVPDIDTCGFNNYSDYLSNPNNTSATPVYDVIKYHEMEKADSNYKVVSAFSLSDDMSYDIQGYDIDPDTGVAGMVVLRGIDGVVQSVDYQSTPFYILTDINDYYEPSLERIIKKITYTSDGINELTALVDNERLFYAYNYIIEGRSANDEDNIFGTEIPAVKKGDIIRVGTNGEFVSHFERVYRLDDIDNTPSSLRYPSVSTGYKLSRSFDVYTSWFANTSSYSLGTIVPSYVKGNVLYGFQGFQTPANITLTDPSSYVTQYMELGAVVPTVLNVFANGNIEVKSGSVSDIITIDEAGGIDGASRVIYMHRDFVLAGMIIINDAR